MIHIAFAADERYVPHAAAMIHSAASQRGASPLTFHFLHPQDLSPSTRESLCALGKRLGTEVLCHGFTSTDVEGLPAMGRITPVMWLRIFLPRLLPGISRVLYLDCDTLVMDSLESLWHTDLKGAWLGAVSNVFEAGREGHARRLGLAAPRDYFNSGVLLLDLDAWRREGCAERILALARDPDAGLVWPDQDALNTVFAGHWHSLHPRWNCQNSLFYFKWARDVFGDRVVAEATSRPGILHFEGGALSKPWHYLCKHPWRGEYFRHRAETPWPFVTIEGRTAKNRLLRLLPARLLIPAFVTVWRLKQASFKAIARLRSAVRSS
jgi:lipopolysaccharide biosynthesis glycosyltransferase